MDQNLIKMDGVLWSKISNKDLEPLCPIHHLRLDYYPSSYNEYSAHQLTCEECENRFILPRTVNEEKKYIFNKLDSKLFKKMKTLNLDDEAIPIAEDKKSSADGKFFVTAILTESKVGKRLVVYAGERGANNKTQIFIEPDIKRIAFDQRDLHPSDVFVKLEGTFKGGTKMSIESSKPE